MVVESRVPAELAVDEACVHLGLGANLGEPVATLEWAVDRVAEMAGCRLLARSGWWRSAPLGPQDQPDYVNGVIALATRLRPLALLDSLQAIELEGGRERGERWGARTIDLDLLLWGDLVLDHPRLQLPHPEISARRFVLLPLAEIAPDLGVPGIGPVTRLLAQCADWPMERITHRPSGLQHSIDRQFEVVR